MDRHGTGTALRELRERRRISLETISRATMIRRDYLELIDTEQLERLPAGAYAKGFIRAYAGYLGVDPRPFIQGYEQRCEDPAPELSSVVRQPVRVPHATQPRTWRIAAGGGVGILLLLGLLGVLRPGERTARPPTQASAQLASVTSANGDGALGPAANPVGAVVRVDAVDADVWVEAQPDGATEFSGVLAQGTKRVFRGEQSLRIIVGNPSAVRLRVNGLDVGTPPGTTFRAVITPTTRGLPAPEPTQ